VLRTQRGCQGPRSGETVLRDCDDDDDDIDVDDVDGDHYYYEGRSISSRTVLLMKHRANTEYRN